jgi:hypothetical protein
MNPSNDPDQTRHQALPPPGGKGHADPEALPAYDAWYFARALAGRPLEGLTRGVSPTHRPVAERLAEVPPDGRASAWEGSLAAITEQEAEARTQAIASINPDDPPPEDQTWGQPLAFKLPPVVEFPLDVFPEPVRRLVLQVARAINCPLDFPALTALVVAGAAIGRSVSLKLKAGYFASASMYAACVGQPGDGKSPAVGHVTSPMFRIDEAHFERWNSERDAFEDHLARYEEATRTSRKGRPSRDRADDEAGDAGIARSDSSMPCGPGKPTPPILRRNVIGDSTTEAMDALMGQNPRGLLQVLDEASTLTSSMNQYRGGKGSDRQWYMSTWSGQARIVDRKGNADLVPIRVPYPFLSLVGGMVPDMIGSFCDEQGRHDGFLDRILFAYPDQVPKVGWREDGVADDVAADWSEIVSRLQARPLIVEDTRTRAHVVRFTPDGKRAWSEMIDAHSAEQRSADFPQSLSGPWAKLEQYVGRISLILHMLWHAADPTSDETSVPDVTTQTVRAADRLLAYFKSHTRRVHEAMRARARGEEGSDDVQSILKWIFRRRTESFSVRDLTRDLSCTFGKRAHALQEALDWLAKTGCILFQQPPNQPKKKLAGRSKSPTYLVNPHLLTSQNRQSFDPGSLPQGPEEQAEDSGDFATDSEAQGGKEGGDGHPAF